MSMEKLDVSRSYPLKYAVDICVVGAGPAGIAAAVTAARNDAKVLIVDTMSMPGGMSTAALVPAFMMCSDGVNFLPGGFGREVIDNLHDAAARRNFDCGGTINAEHLKRIYEHLLLGSGAQILYYTRMFDAVVENGVVKAILCNTPGGNFAVSADVFIDATGDGTLAAMAGAPYRQGGEEGQVMPSTLCSMWAGMDMEAYRKGGAFGHDDDNMLQKLRQAFSDGLLSVEDYHHTGMFAISRVAAVANISHAFDVDPTNAESLTAGTIHSRAILAEYEDFYRQRIDGFSNAEIVSTASTLGIRESRRIIGEYVLDRADFDARRDFEDEIGRYNAPADIHPSRPGMADLVKHKELYRSSACGFGESYGIPYRILLPLETTNLLTCGRCVSCDRHVMTSIRMIPACYITGQAAGMAAAFAAASGMSLREIPITQLRDRLRKIGAFFH